MCSNKIYEAATDSVLYIVIWENKRYVDWEDIAFLWPSTYQEHRKAHKSGGHRGLTGWFCIARIKFLWRSYKIWGKHGPPGSYAYVYVANTQVVKPMMHNTCETTSTQQPDWSLSVCAYVSTFKIWHWIAQSLGHRFTSLTHAVFYWLKATALVFRRPQIVTVQWYGNYQELLFYSLYWYKAVGHQTHEFYMKTILVSVAK